MYASAEVVNLQLTMEQSKGLERQVAAVVHGPWRQLWSELLTPGISVKSPST